MLIVDGSPCGSWDGRFLIIVDGEERHLSLNSFRYVATLAVQRINTDDGWVRTSDLDSELAARYIYRMKGESGLSVENDRAGSYRLEIAPSEIKVDFHGLSRNPDCRV